MRAGTRGAGGAGSAVSDRTGTNGNGASANGNGAWANGNGASANGTAVAGELGDALAAARTASASEHPGAARALKRGFDLVGSLVLLIVLSPVLLLIALIIKVDSPGPILFKQQRVGRDGKPFWMFKFRTMIRDADAKKLEILHLNVAGDGLFKDP